MRDLTASAIDSVSSQEHERLPATCMGTQVRVQRAGAPIFDTIIQLKRGEVNTWTIIQNTGLAVDAILNGEPYDVQRRVRIENEKLQAPKTKVWGY